MILLFTLSALPLVLVIVAGIVLLQRAAARRRPVPADLRRRILSMTGAELHARMRSKGGRPARIIDSHSGREVKIGGEFRSPDGRATLVRLGTPILRDTPEGQEVGVFGIFVIKKTGKVVEAPMPYRYDHPSFPDEVILFIPS